MPKYVDPQKRMDEIVDASERLLSTGGFANLTLRNLAKQMGGSITLVTHYFESRAALVTAILDRSLKETDAFIESLERISDASERLRTALMWFLPADEVSLQAERAHIALVAHREAEPAIQQFLDQVEPAMRRAITMAINEFVPPGELGGLVDILRVWTSGMILSAVEHPEVWTPKKQVHVLEQFLGHLQLPASYRADFVGA